MKSSELFNTEPKPMSPASVPQNNPEPEEPISTRTSHLNDRGNEFDRNSREPINESESPEPGDEPQVLTVEEMLEMEDAELKSYGIDDPKTWKSYQRLLHKKEAEWKLKERVYEETLNKLKVNQPARNEEPESRQDPRAPLKPPVKPRKPANYDYAEALTDSTSESARYLAEVDRYREEKDAYQDAVIANLTGYVSNEQQTKIQQRKREEVKSMSLSRFQQRGLNAQEASNLFDRIEQAYMSDAETGADIFVSLFKGGRVNGSKEAPVNNNGRRKLPENIIMPPGVNTSTAKPTESNTKNFMQGIQGGNQTRRIILNREKRK